MTPEQHNVLAQLAQLGLQKLAEIAQEGLTACAPMAPPLDAEPEDPAPGGADSAGGAHTQAPEADPEPAPEPAPGADNVPEAEPLP